MPGMESGNRSTDLMSCQGSPSTDSMSCLAFFFWRQVWRQKADNKHHAHAITSPTPASASPYMKTYKPELVKWFRAWSLSAFWRQTWRQKTMPHTASGNPSNWSFDAMSGIVFWRHVWRQKANELHTLNHLPNSALWGFICRLLLR